jgi:RND superfamily putative drug exporter
MQGQIVFQARTGAVAADETTVNQSTANVAKLPHVIKAVSPFASSDSAAVSKDGTIAYASVSWNVNPGSLDNAYLNELNAAVAPAMKAGLGVSYGAGAGEIGPKTSDLASEAIGLGCALLLLVFMFGSLLAAAVPLLSAVFAVSAGLSLLGLGVAVDYGLFLMARHREQLDSGMEVITSARLAVGTSGAAIVVAGSTVVTSILGLYIAGVAFVGALGLAAAIVVAITMLAALTLVPARMGVAGLNVRALTARLRARKEGISVQQQAAVTAAATHERHEQSAFARWGRKVSERPWPWAVISVAVLAALAIPLLSMTLGPTTAPIRRRTAAAAPTTFSLTASGSG